MPTDNKPLPDVLLRAPLWMMAHGIDPSEIAQTDADPERCFQEDGYATDAAGTFEG